MRFRSATADLQRGFGHHFLLKPFRTQGLLDAVQRGVTADRSGREEAAYLNRQIADALSLSEVTAKVHRASVMRKMLASSLPELVRMAGGFPERHQA